ncbi:STAS domain-containing protein [Amycolatopsis sp. lyj-23]|uniref:STAS domain-containing protein n=1 Tax=Amycolatopsis sp. lyj-23 TaxID=2789283 RepID=UPI00397E112E
MSQHRSGGKTLADLPAPSFGARIVQGRPGVVTVAVSGELDSVTVPGLDKAVRDALAARPWRLTVDLTAVTFCGSAGLRTLVALHAAAGAAAARMAVRPSPAIGRLLAVTHLDRTLPVLDPARS